MVYRYESHDLGVFAQLAELLKGLHALGVQPVVEVRGTDAPAAVPVASAAPAAPTRGRRRAAVPAPSVANDAAPAASVAGDPLEDMFGDDPGDADDADVTGANAGLSPAEALDLGLTLVRAVYNAGHKKEVKELQAAFGVAKFADVPVDRGHDFYKLVLALAEKTGVSV